MKMSLWADGGKRRAFWRVVMIDDVVGYRYLVKNVLFLKSRCIHSQRW